ncbi:GGDEF domain-containing protein [Thermodesulfobacteriota bacterium]
MSTSSTDNHQDDQKLENSQELPEDRPKEGLSRKNPERSVLLQIWVVIISGVVGTIVMIQLDAFEKLHRFTRPFEMSEVDEWLAFLPTFLAMGFVLFAYQRVIELREEIARRREVEEQLQESEKRYRELSITDDLTHLYNARYFYAKLAEENTRACRFKHPLSLILLDIDDFKRFNDTYGHLEGDKVLEVVGKAIQHCVRETDSAYRYGGEEFTVILPYADIEAAENAAERIRLDVSVQEFSPTPDVTEKITVSLGVCQLRHGEEITELVKRADDAMYIAKRGGKNRVATSE